MKSTAVAWLLLLATLHPAMATDIAPPVQRDHEVTIDGTKYAYVSQAGQIPIRHTATGEVRGSMFYMAYRLKTPDTADRPVTFFFGGGPSAPAIGFNHRAFGPRAVIDGRLVDNQNSLLPATDLVLVDPVGTGFSRAARVEYEDEFYTARGDALSLAEFVRVWNTLYATPHTPTYLLGGSYGSWRTGIVTEMLEQSGQRVAGSVLLSGGILAGTDYLSENEIVAYRVPDQAMTALHHGLLAPETGSSREEVLANASRWARQVYAPALDRIASLSRSEREDLARQLSLHTGYPLDRIDRDTLKFTLTEFTEHLVPHAQERLSWHDLRTSGRTVLSEEENRLMIHDVRENIGYASDLAYLDWEKGYFPATEGEYRPAGSRWQYDAGIRLEDDSSDDLRSEPWILRSLDINPRLRVFVGYGLYDGANNCLAMDVTKERLEPRYSGQFTTHCYLEGGHRIYGTPSEWENLARDLRAFYSH